ncbi:hypothetical protein ACHAXR_002837 [Thalassiosira sp. AJA248-18]
MLSVSLILIHTSLLLLSNALVSQPKRPIGPIHTLILTRHGDSLWNGKHPGCQETFTGWTDIGLSPIGEQEAIRTGELLTQFTKGVTIDALFTSALTRAKMTAHECWWAYYDRLEQQYQEQKQQQNDNLQYQAPAQFIIDHRLNERHYGSLQGLIKADTAAGVHGHLPEEVYQWRRSWHAIPPPLDDNDPRRIEELRMYGNICGEENVPKSESLAQVAEQRIRPFLTETLTPILDSSYDSKLPSPKGYEDESTVGGTALIVAHANSLRALIGVICNADQDNQVLKKLESMKIPTASPLVLRYRKTAEEGIFFPVDSVLENELQNDLPVYPLTSYSKIIC